MFSYEPAWSDTAVRRFIVKIGVDAIDDLFALRKADNLGSGLQAGAGGLDVLRERVARELAAEIVLDRSRLQIDGHDLMEELGLRQGPLTKLLGPAVVDDLAVVGSDPYLREGSDQTFVFRVRARPAF